MRKNDDENRDTIQRRTERFRRHHDRIETLEKYGPIAEAARQYRIIIPDDSLIDYGVMPGESVLIEEGISSSRSEVECIGRLVVLSGPHGMLIGRYEPPHLVQSYDRISLLSEMEIVGVVWGVAREIVLERE